MRGATKNRVLAFTLDAFQSTRPVRGATLTPKHGKLSPCISIHAPRAGRDAAAAVTPLAADYFNPRAPCGARPLVYIEEVTQQEFQSTRPVRGATQISFLSLRDLPISIHAPRAGRDKRPAAGGR